MRAVELSAFGLEHLTLALRADPSPGPGEALVRMRYASLNYRDLVVARGGYGAQIACPLIPLSDGAGEVLAIGAGVTRVRVGDRVLACFHQSWFSGRPTTAALGASLGGPLAGTLCELRCFSEQGLCVLPPSLSFEAAATLPCAAVTAWNALTVLDRVGPTDWVLVQGTGGVSLFALQFAKLLGARVIATTSREENVERLKALGADHTLNYAKLPEWGKAARALSDGGVDHILEVGGAATLAQSVRAARPGATISLIGVLSGQKPALDLPRIFLPQLRLQGVVVGSRDTTESLLRALALHDLQPAIDSKRFALSSARDAFEYLAAARHFGKITLQLDA